MYRFAFEYLFNNAFILIHIINLVNIYLNTQHSQNKNDKMKPTASTSG